MNEFTKEELKEIQRCLNYMTKGHVTPYSSFTLEINKKIQSMIDSYCNHWDYRKDEYMMCICNKCHKAFNNDDCKKNI